MALAIFDKVVFSRDTSLINSWSTISFFCMFVRTTWMSASSVFVRPGLGKRAWSLQLRLTLEGGAVGRGLRKEVDLAGEHRPLRLQLGQPLLVDLLALL